MADYDILFVRSARKELERLPPLQADRILSKIKLLRQNPRPPGCKKLVRSQSLWRIRVGEYRVVYEILEASKTIEIGYIRHRREIYRDL